MKEKTFNKIIIFIVSLIIFSGIMLFAILLVFPLIIPTEIYEKIYDYLLIGDLILGITAIYIHVTLSTLNVKSESDIFKTKKADAYKFKINSSNYSTVYNDIVTKLTEQKYKLILEKKYDNEEELNIYEKKISLGYKELYAIIRMKEYIEKEEINNDLQDVIDNITTKDLSVKMIIIVDNSTESFKEYLFTNCLIEPTFNILPAGIELNTKSLYVHKQNDSTSKSTYKYMRDSFIYIMKLNPKEYTILQNTTEEKPKSTTTKKDKIIKLNLRKDYIIIHTISIILYISGIILFFFLKGEWTIIPAILAYTSFFMSAYSNEEHKKPKKKKKLSKKEIESRIIDIIFIIIIIIILGLCLTLVKN